MASVSRCCVRCPVTLWASVHSFGRKRPRYGFPDQWLRLLNKSRAAERKGAQKKCSNGAVEEWPALAADAAKMAVLFEYGGSWSGVVVVVVVEVVVVVVVVVII